MKEAFDGALKCKPQSEADYFRCAFLSLAISYMDALDELKANSGKDFDTLYIVGGFAVLALLSAGTVCRDIARRADG